MLSCKGVQVREVLLPTHFTVEETEAHTADVTHPAPKIQAEVLFPKLPLAYASLCPL